MGSYEPSLGRGGVSYFVTCPVPPLALESAESAQNIESAQGQNRGNPTHFIEYLNDV